MSFTLEDSSDYYLELSANPKRFEPDSPVTNVFFDDTNGQVFTVRSGGISGVTVSGMDEEDSTSFIMEDKGPIVSIKFSLDHKILGIQRNRDNQAATVEFLNFEDSAPTNIEYAHMCRWKNAKILGFVWPKANEIAFVTDHGIELLQVFPEKKMVKSIKNTSFSGAWFSWCAQSKTVLLAGNNSTLLQPFSLNNSTIAKLPKIELESGRAVVSRDVCILQIGSGVWCAVFRHSAHLASATGPTEVYLMPITGCGNQTHVLKTGLVGRFAVSIIDELIVVHHQSSQTSLIFDLAEDVQPENNLVVHIPLLPGQSIRPAVVDDQPCPMYSGTWVVFQPDYMIDARLGCLWKLKLSLTGLLHKISNDDVPKIIGVLLRREGGRSIIMRALHQLVSNASMCLPQLTGAFDTINSVYRKWAESEVARSTAGGQSPNSGPSRRDMVIDQNDMCNDLLRVHADDPFIVQVVTAYIGSLCRHDIVVRDSAAELCARTLLAKGAASRLTSLVRRGCLADGKPLACQLLSLGHIQPPAAQLALDMMSRLKANEEIIEVLLSYNEPISAIGAARQAGGQCWSGLSARKVLEVARKDSPQGFVAAYRALRARDQAEVATHRAGYPYDQSDIYADLYKKLTSE